MRTKLESRKTPRRRWQTGLAAVALSATLFLLSGCFIVSIHPLHSAGTLVHHRELAGVWGDPEDSLESWEFVDQGEGAYRLIIRGEDPEGIQPNKEGVMIVHLMKLGDEMFMDFFPDEPEGVDEIFLGHVIPAHSLWHVRIDDDVLSLSLMDQGNLQRGIRAGTIAIDHVMVDNTLVLTAETDDLQRLVMDHLEELFQDTESLQRIR